MTPGDVVRDAPRVSIVMPMYNSAAHLESTVASVLAQTLPEWELILFDDGSTDATPEIARRLVDGDPRIRTGLGRHAGVGVARNDGLLLTDRRAEYVVFLDSDDTWESDALACLVETLDAAPSAPAAHALARGTDMDGEQIEGDDLADQMRHRQEWANGRLSDVPQTSATPFSAMIVQNWVVTPGTSIIRRAALDRIGVLDPATSPADDWDLNVRLTRLGELRVRRSHRAQLAPTPGLAGEHEQAVAVGVPRGAQEVDQRADEHAGATRLGVGAAPGRRQYVAGCARVGGQGASTPEHRSRARVCVDRLRLLGPAPAASAATLTRPTVEPARVQREAPATGLDAVASKRAVSVSR